MEEQTQQPINQQVPIVPTEPKQSPEDREIERLTRENEEKRIAFEKRRDIERLKQENARIDAGEREMNKAYNPRFKFTKEKAKFWSIAAVIALAVAVILVKVMQKLF